MKYIFSIIFTLLLTSSLISAQELDARIQVSASRIQGTSNQQLFQNMQQSLYELLTTQTGQNMFMIKTKELNVIL